MRRKLTAVLLGGAIVAGSLGFAGTVEARPASTNAATQNAVNRIVAQITARCAAQPSAPLCRQVNRLTPAQVNNISNRVTQAVRQAGGIGAVQARLGPLRQALCANPGVVLNRVPVQFRAQATAAVARLCAS
jgi:hypothetical protein